ncbi:MAG: response regulator transcription factor [Clostridia bacterium]|nr:response regulator transcription factor [Clostridia bacterium]
MDKIKILIVEDDPDWTKSMVNFLHKQNDIEVVATASNKQDAIKLANPEQVDVILMDINLTENKYDGIYAAAEIQQSKKVKIIMLTSLSDEDIITNSFNAGAVNYISKTNYKELPNAIRSTYKTTSPIEVLLKDYSRLKEEEQLKDLTPAEKEVFDLIKAGYTQSQIEKKLNKAESTLKNQVNKILKKLNVRSCKEALHKVKTRGLLKQSSEKQRNE